MKNWQAVCILAASVVIALLGWSLAPVGNAPSEQREDMRVKTAKIGEKSGSKRTERRIAAKDSIRPDKSFSLNDSDDKMDLSFGDDFRFEEEIKEKLTAVIQEIYDQYLAASNRENKKEMLAAIQRLLAKAAAGEKIPVWLRRQMIEEIKWVGGSALPEMIAMAADQDVEVASSALEALQDLLWDFDTTPQQIADAISQVVKISTDSEVIEPFIFEMSDMSTQLKVSTALAIMDSGNATAVECLTENMDFIFDSFDNPVRTREDIVQYGEDNAVVDDASTTISE